MAKATTFDLACNTCEEIGPSLVVGRAVRGRPHHAGRPRAGAAAGLEAWAQFTTSHGRHDLRLLAAGYDPVLPLAGWMPRPPNGPPDSGRLSDQLIACPDCRAIYRNGNPDRPAVAYLTADNGTKWFLFCRQCRNVWGQAAIDRMVRADLGRTPIEEALWTLQRQGIQLDQILDEDR